MQTIMVQAVVGEGYDGAYRARRKWPATEPVSVEVLDQDDDPPDHEHPHVVDGKVVGKRMVPDPHRIGRKSFEAIKADSRLRILGDKDTDRSASGAALDKARSMAAAHASENSDLKVKLAGLEDENRRLKEQLRTAGVQPAAPPAAAPEGQGEEHQETEGTEGEGGVRTRRRTK
jgi:hypothetical protein